MSGAHSKRRDLEKGRKAVGGMVIALAVLAVVGFLSVGANGPADPRLGGIAGFGEVAFHVSPGGANGSATRFCALLAESEQQRAQGLMGRKDLAGFDAMVFRFDTDSTGGFFMRDVPVALSIAWFDVGGRFVSSAEMSSCPDQDGCPTYTPPGPYRVAVEVLKGGLGRLRIGAGSTIAVGGACAH